MDTVFVQYNEADERISQTGQPMPMQNEEGLPMGDNFPILKKPPTSAERKKIWPTGARKIYQVEKPADWDASERAKEEAKNKIQRDARKTLDSAMLDPSITDFNAYRQTVLAKMNEDLSKI